MKPLRLAVIGFGKLGRACAEAIRRDDQLALAGIVRRPESLAEQLPADFAQTPAVSHARELKGVEGALICVPTEHVLAVARDLLQHGTPIVECAMLHDVELREHLAEVDRLAHLYEKPAIVGAGWDPGALSLLRALLALLIPRGQTETSWRTGASLHHTCATASIPGVRESLATELRGADGQLRRYVYVELEQGADADRVKNAIAGDPLFLEEQTLVIPVASIRELEEQGRGVSLERRGGQQMVLLEARFSETALAAAVMTAAARALPGRRRGAHSLFELPLGNLWGELKGKVKQEWL
jgi:diaminopimelate dehydrogenase